MLDHLKRYRITTKETLELALFTGERTKSFNNVIYRGLIKKGLLESRELSGSRVFFQLTEQGTREAEAPADAAKPLTAGKLFELYAELLFCCHDTPSHPKLTTEEFNHWFPGRLGERRLGAGYYIDEDAGVRRLGRLLVDLGRNLPNARDVVLRDVRALGDDFLGERRFTIAVITSSRSAERDARACMRPLEEQGVRIITRNFREQLSPMLAGLAKSGGAGKASVAGASA